MNEKILIVEDDLDLRELMAEIFEEEGYSVVTAENGKVALEILADEKLMFDLVFTDVQMPELKGDVVLQNVRKKRGETPVIVVTAFGSVEQAVEMVKNGAFQYITKPFKAEELIDVAQIALGKSEQIRAVAKLKREQQDTPEKIVGASRPMQDLFDLINRAGRSMSNVLITGESGTGKELVARAVHNASNLDGNFIAVNCAAIPSELVESELFGHTGQAFTGAKGVRAGLFESADGGTVFLDEIAELPLSVQPKLLRVIQEGTVRRVGSDFEKKIKVRVIAATNRDLETEVEENRFREDLFWRLNVIHLRVPPLRERAFDIPLLVEHFLGKYSLTDANLEIAPETLAVLTAYPWQGNVRELENTIERAVALTHGAILTTEDLPGRIRRSKNSSVLIEQAKSKLLTMAELEKTYILEILKKTEGNKSQAAKILGLDRKTLYRKIDEYRQENPDLDI
jgi:DNA-binding NtrC family response regulator